MIILVEKSARQNSAYRHLNMKGAFGNEGALRFLAVHLAAVADSLNRDYEYGV